MYLRAGQTLQKKISAFEYIAIQQRLPELQHKEKKIISGDADCGTAPSRLTCTQWSSEESAEEKAGKYLKTYGQNLSTFNEKFNPNCIEAQQTTGRINTKKTVPRHLIIKFQKPLIKMKISKAARRKGILNIGEKRQNF